VCLFLTALGTLAEVGTALQMQLGNPSNATADANDHNHYLIQRTVEAIDYDDARGEANWVSWDLTAGDIGSAGRSPSFITDNTLPAGFGAVMTGDYTNSGFNRGHLCPSADRTANDADNALVFFLSNIVPQTPDNNQGPWASFETYCRSLATSGKELLIIAGGSGFSGSWLPSGRAAIPGALWKIVVVVPAGGGTALSRIDATTRVIAIKMPNTSGIRNNSWAQYLTSPSQIQADTGYTFFTALPDNVAMVLRAKVDGQSTPQFATISPTSGQTGSTVVITGTGFTGATGVSFGDVAAFFVVNSDTQITATVPAGARSGSVKVSTPGGPFISAASFTVIACPTIASFSPSSGSVDGTVVLAGAGFGGASSVTFNSVAAAFTVNSDGQLTATVPAGARTGPIGVVTPGGSTAGVTSFIVKPPGTARPVISQIYGAGGNSGATYKCDFVEIYNAGTAPVDLGNYAVQYCSATGSSWVATFLTGTLQPGRYCLVQEAQGNAGTLDLPTPQVIGTINLSAASGKVALTSTRTLLTGANPLGNAAIVDFVGYGTADAFAGSADAPQLTATTAAARAHAGGTNTNDNAADFTACPPAPRAAAAMDAWRSRSFSAGELASATASGDLANPSGDGVSNLLKYAFNLDPHAVDGRTACTYTSSVSGSDRILTLTHRLNHFAADITCTYEVSFDLVTWTPLDAPTLSVAMLDAQTDLVTISVATAAPSFFIRVQASR
jgi:DNA/RNA endonuclease G (NUC1)